MPDNQSKVITISKVETKMFDSTTQYKITGNGLTFKFYDTKKSGGNTVAYEQFRNMGLKIGSTVSVWYKEEEKEYEGKPYTDRLIASFKETNDLPKATFKQENTYQKEEPKDEKFWDKKAFKQCLWNYWLASQKPSSDIEPEWPGWKDIVWEVFNEIEQDADKRFSTGMEKAARSLNNGIDMRSDEDPGPEIEY